MTDSLFFDCDCISAFLWINNESLLVKLYPAKIVIPKAVYDELSYPGITHLKARIDTLLSKGQTQIMTIDYGSVTYSLYQQLTVKPLSGYKVIGKGEASCIALAKQYDATVASNNLKDITPYITQMGLKQITTGKILLEALEKGYITEDEGNIIWANMLAKRRKLGAPSFTTYREQNIKVDAR